MKLLRKFGVTSLLSAGFLLVPATFMASASAQTEDTPVQNQSTTAQQPYHGQDDHDNIQTKTTQGEEPTKTEYTEQQLLTSTVHQAWLLSGKNEANFFEIVEQLADISAHNRNVTLPDSAAAGRRMGEYIKRMAKSDTDQLLYAVVDKAVVNATAAAPHRVGTKAEGTKAAETKATEEPQDSAAAH